MISPGQEWVKIVKYDPEKNELNQMTDLWCKWLAYHCHKDGLILDLIDLIVNYLGGEEHMYAKRYLIEGWGWNQR